jgi:uncharacterized paraquat-inducible protein A
MKHRHSMKPKRGQCEGCPAIKNVKTVLIAGKRVDLCPRCVTVLQRMKDLDLRTTVSI